MGTDHFFHTLYVYSMCSESIKVQDLGYICSFCGTKYSKNHYFSLFFNFFYFLICFCRGFNGTFDRLTLIILYTYTYKGAICTNHFFHTLYVYSMCSESIKVQDLGGICSFSLHIMSKNHYFSLFFNFFIF